MIICQIKPVTNITSDPTFFTPDYVSLIARNLTRFPQDIIDGTNTTDPVKLYRDILSKVEDNSVTIVSIGFWNNLADVLHSGPDNYSSLTGRELLGKKVAEVVVQGGTFNPTTTVGYNLSSSPQLLPSSCNSDFATCSEESYCVEGLGGLAYSCHIHGRRSWPERLYWCRTLRHTRRQPRSRWSVFLVLLISVLSLHSTLNSL